MSDCHRRNINSVWLIYAQINTKSFLRTIIACTSWKAVVRRAEGKATTIRPSFYIQRSFVYSKGTSDEEDI